MSEQDRWNDALEAAKLHGSFAFIVISVVITGFALLSEGVATAGMMFFCGVFMAALVFIAPIANYFMRRDR